MRRSMSVGTYFLYKFDFRQSESEESVSQAVQQFVSDADLDTVGCWRPEIGDGSMRRGETNHSLQ